MSERIQYTSENGYTGILYGKSSLMIFDKDGKLSLHTGFRSANTYEELVEIVEEHPQLLKLIHSIPFDDDDDEEDA